MLAPRPIDSVLLMFGPDIWETNRQCRNAGEGDGMDTLWTFLKGRALYVSVAHDAFSFDISWLGIVLVVSAALLIRHLRR